MGPFKIISKVIKVSYRLDLLLKIKIHLVYYIVILKPVCGNYKPPVYEQKIYKGQEQNEWLVKKILQYDEVDG